jgi:parallel beta-helix repeat protein
LFIHDEKARACTPVALDLVAFDTIIAVDRARSHDSIFGNNITANSRDGIYLYESSNNTISKNSITANNWGIYFYTSCYNNTIYHNNLINNTNQVDISYDSVNVWDDGYPSGGNY